MFFPHLAELLVEEVTDHGDYVLVTAHTEGGPAACRACGTVSSRVHGRYRRLLHDLPAAGRPVLIALTVRRLTCQNPACPVRTFAEPVPGLTRRYARRTKLLRRLLELMALALAGRAASRLLEQLGVRVGRDTLIALVRALPDPEIGQVTVLGVDDFAKKRGRSYATVLINMDTHQPIDVLDDRTADALEQWLRDHPGVDVICRDRAGAYAAGAKAGAPEAIQIADRFHLWQNLCDAVEKTVIACRADLREPDADAAEPAHEEPGDQQLDNALPPKPMPDQASEEECQLIVRTRERYAAVRELAAKDWTISAIARKLQLSRPTVRRFARAEAVEDLLTKATGRSDLLTPYLPYLIQRFNDGCTDAARLTREIQAHGYLGSPQTVRRYLHPLRASATAAHAPSSAPTIREATRWITRRPDRLTPDEQARLADLRARSPRLDATAGHVAAFAQMMTTLTGTTENLQAWMAAVNADDLPGLHSFTHGIRRDLDAVVNGLTLPHSSGAVEGNVTRVKALKRSRYGRAKFDLLRKIILCAP
ncbi:MULTISPECIES: ISL3 family transposase [unclassified Nonomuraea]|uniref:ISL3 family transposase n=1 Tax=unclassified Nonomuraea TaxID=2593643 RepID=UPI00191C6DBC|nr:MULTISPECIES: ISL3 family transposase [unclassified Nonomuraea]